MFSTASTTISTTSTLGHAATAIEFLNVSGTRYLYYCSSYDNHIYLRNLDNSTEMMLPWSVSSIKCTGNTLYYDSSAHSLIFPFTQNGLTGVGEMTGVDPSLNGM
jgi:hypothetical protein